MKSIYTSLLRKGAIALMGAAMLASCSGKEAKGEQEQAQSQADRSEFVIPYEYTDTLVGKPMPSYPVVTRFGKESNITDFTDSKFSVVTFIKAQDESYFRDMHKILEDNDFDLLVADRYMTMVLVYTDLPQQDLGEHAMGFDSAWVITCLNTDQISADSISVPHNPTYYVVDEEGIVVAQDPSLKKMMQLVHSKFN